MVITFDGRIVFEAVCEWVKKNDREVFSSSNLSVALAR
jgi:hypothetical protein